MPIQTPPPTAADEQFQIDSLQGVSRTFALTIPQLPASLARVVSNAYLLCRIADTIEDDPDLGIEAQHRFAELFIAVVGGEADAEAFASELYPLLSPRMLEDERELVRQTPAVIRITHSCNAAQRAAMLRCVRIMATGMAYYQAHETLEGLPDLPAMDRYCYYVAGVVGEMLTELFCDHSPEIARHRETMMALSPSFGQGLQMTNILKDIWEDRTRGACWLPRDILGRHGVDLRQTGVIPQGPGFEAALGELIGVARHHLENALRYTLLIPAHEKGLRRFCLWALGMAVLTLKKLNAHRDFRAGREVKISRNSVRATILFTNLAIASDGLLKWMFAFATKGLPRCNIRETLKSPVCDSGSNIEGRLQGPESTGL
jgi:farnesyl-diphosphate farnesyltransferase